MLPLLCLLTSLSGDFPHDVIQNLLQNCQHRDRWPINSKPSAHMGVPPSCLASPSFIASSVRLGATTVRPPERWLSAILDGDSLPAMAHRVFFIRARLASRVSISSLRKNPQSLQRNSGIQWGHSFENWSSHLISMPRCFRRAGIIDEMSRTKRRDLPRR